MKATKDFSFFHENVPSETFNLKKVMNLTKLSSENMSVEIYDVLIPLLHITDYLVAIFTVILAVFRCIDKIDKILTFSYFFWGPRVGFLKWTHATY